MEETDYSKLGDFLDWWHANPGPMSMEGLQEHLADPEIFNGIRLGCIGFDDVNDTYVLKSVSMLDNQFGVDSFRFHRQLGDLASTMKSNKHKVRKFERTAFVAGLPESDVEEARAWVREKMAPVLEEINDYLVKRSVPKGVRFGVSMFQFDSEG